MKKAWLLWAIGLLLGSCGGPRDTGEEQEGACRVYNLEVESASRQLTARWKSACGELIRGYNVYISRQPLVQKYPADSLPETVEPYNRVPFPGDTNPEDEWETFVADDLENGVKYYVSVRVVYSDATLSRPTDEVVTVCGPRGEVELGIRYTGEQDGYSFAQGRYVEADELANDVYFLSQNGTDYLDSPTRLDGFLRKTRLTVLPSVEGLEAAVEYVTVNDVVPQQDRVQVETGDWVLLKTPESHHALIEIRDFSGTGSERRIRLFYVYSGIAGEFVL